MGDCADGYGYSVCVGGVYLLGDKPHDDDCGAPLGIGIHRRTLLVAFSCGGEVVYDVCRGVALYEYFRFCQTCKRQRNEPCACTGLLAGDELDGGDPAVRAAAAGDGAGVFDFDVADVGVTSGGEASV